MKEIVGNNHRRDEIDDEGMRLMMDGEKDDSLLFEDGAIDWLRKGRHLTENYNLEIGTTIQKKN